MAMTPDEMLAFFRQQASSSASNLDAPAVRDNPHLFCLNVRQTCQHSLMAALVASRHQLDDPLGDLQSSLENGERFAPAVVALDMPVPVHERIRLHDITLCSVLTGAEPSAEIVSILLAALPAADPETALDLSLALSLNGSSDLLRSAIADFSPIAESQLVHDTFTIYSRILSGDVNAIADADANFTRRATDGYFAGGLQIDGGGPDNPHTIDYRLAAIIRSLGLSVTTIHQMPAQT